MLHACKRLHDYHHVKYAIFYAFFCLFVCWGAKVGLALNTYNSTFGAQRRGRGRQSKK